MPIEPQVRDAIDHFTARVRHDVDVHVDALTVELLRLVEERETHWRGELLRGAEDARAEVEQTFPARIETLRQAWTRELASPVAFEAGAPPDASGPAVRSAHLDIVGRLLDAVRRIDDATTLTGILEALVRGTAAEASRAAIMLVEGDMLRTWGHFGFSGEVAPADLRVTEVGFVTAAIALRQTSFVPPSIGETDPASPEFMHVPAGHTGLVTPIVVGTDVAAVLYADDVGRPLTQEDAPVWTEVVELFVRHASVRLENVTSIQTPDLLTNPV